MSPRHDLFVHHRSPHGSDAGLPARQSGSALPLLILVSVLIAAALAWWTLSRSFAGSETLTRDHQDLAPFHAIEIGGRAHVTLVQGDAESIDVEAAGRGARIEANVSNGRLVIRAHTRRRVFGFLSGRRAPAAPTITVRFRRLEAIAVSGGIRMDVPRLDASTLRVVASGGTRLSVRELRAASLRVEGSGALDATLSGQVDTERVSISGAGSYDGQHLRAADADVTVSGVGNVVVHAERTLRATISGAGNVEYVGDPVVTERVSGIGRVRRREPKNAPGQRTVAPSFPLSSEPVGATG
ncbi:MAG: head GIN domain-containing protein [Rudaea sp.]